MKPVSGAFLSFIVNAQQMLIAELYTFTLQGGSIARFTNLDIDITHDGNLFVSNSIRVEGLRYKLTNTLEVDEQEVRLSAYSTETLAGAAFFSGVQQGLLDGATVMRQRAFWEVVDGRAYVDYLAAPIEVVTLFTGFVSTITKIGRTHAELKVKSALKLLDIDLPRNNYSPGCQWTLYDAGCGVTRATFTQSKVVGSATVLSVTPTVAISPVNGADGVPYFLQGRLLFTSGVNNGLQTMVSTNDSTTLTLQYPLTVAPDPGDTFEVSAGCTKTTETCDLKFSNLEKHRGFPRVPPIVMSV